MSPPTSPSPRVLCLTLRSGSVGHAVVDGFGVTPRSFFTSRFDHLVRRDRLRAIVRLLLSSYQRFRPTYVVLGLPGRLHPERSRFAERLKQHLERLGITAIMKRLRDAAALFVARVRYRMSDELVNQLATHFVPDHVPGVPRERARAPHRRPAWYAVAVALAVLVEHHPRAAAALAQPSAFSIGTFHEAVLAAEHRLASLAV